MDPAPAIAAITVKARSSPPKTYVTLRSGSVSLRSVVVISTPASGQSRLGMLTIFDNIDIRQAAVETDAVKTDAVETGAVEAAAVVTGPGRTPPYRLTA